MTPEEEAKLEAAFSEGGGQKAAATPDDDANKSDNQGIRQQINKPPLMQQNPKYSTSMLSLRKNTASNQQTLMLSNKRLHSQSSFKMLIHSTMMS